MKLTTILTLNEGDYSKLAEWETAAKKLGYTVTKDAKTGTYHAWDKTSHKGRFSAPTGKGSLTEGLFDRFKKKVAPTPQRLPIDAEQRAFIKKYFPSRHNADVIYSPGKYVLPDSVRAVSGKGIVNFTNYDGNLTAHVAYHKSEDDAQNPKATPLTHFDELINGPADMEKLVKMLNESTAPRKGTVAWEREQQRKKQARDPEETKRIEKIGDKNHQVGSAKVTHESVHDKAVEWFKTSKPSECSKCGSNEFFRTSHAHTQKIVCSRCGTVAATKEITEGIGDTIKRVAKKLTAPVKDPILDQMKAITDTAHKRAIDAQNKKYAPKASVSESSNNDMTGCECTKCHKGTYQETSQMDDMDGKLHCTNCGKEVRRWQKGVAENIGDTTKRGIMGDSGRIEEGDRVKTPLGLGTVDTILSLSQKVGVHLDSGQDKDFYPEDVIVVNSQQGMEEADKHSFIGKIQRHHELKKKVDSTWKDAADAEHRGDKAGATRSFNKHVRYANLERPGTFRDVKEYSDQQKWKVTYDIHGSNRDVPLYTNTRTVTASSADEAIATLKGLVGGRNHKAVVAETATVKEASPLSSVGFSDEFINAVYRKFNIDSTTIPDTATSKPKSSDLEKFVFLSRTPSGKAFAIGKGKNGWNSPGYGQLIVDDEGKIEHKSAPVSKVLSLVAKGQYYTIEYSNSYDRVRNQQSTQYKREDPKTGREVDPQDATYAYMQKIEKIYGARIRSEMEKVVDFVYANMRKFGQQRSSNISGTSPQERVLKIANKLEAAAKDEHLFTTRSGSWDRPSYYEQYLNSLDKLSHGYASVPTNYYTFKRVMDETPAGLAKFAKFILNTVHTYENEVKDLLANNG